MFPKSKVTADTLRNRKMAVLLLSITIALSYLDRHFENTFHKVKLPICFPSKLIISVLCKAQVRIYFFLLAVCVFVIKAVLQV